MPADEHLSDPGERESPPQSSRFFQASWASTVSLFGEVLDAWRVGVAPTQCHNNWLRYDHRQRHVETRLEVPVREYEETRGHCLRAAARNFSLCYLGTARCSLLIPLSLWRAMARFTKLHVIRVASYSSHSPGLYDMILNRFPYQIGFGSLISKCSDGNQYVDNVLALRVVPSGWSNIRLRSVGEACMLIARHVHVRRVSVGRYHQHDH